MLYNLHRPEMRLDCYGALNLVGLTFASNREFTDRFELSFPMFGMKYDLKEVIHRIYRMK